MHMLAIMRYLESTLAVLLLVFSVTAAGLFVTRSRSVVCSFTESGDPVHEPVFAVLNPFRDRAPERAAESVLEDLKRNDYARALSKIDDPNAAKEEIAAQDREHRLQSWRLTNRSDRGTTTRLFYWADRSTRGSHDLPLWMTLEQVRGHWHVKSYETWY